MSTGSCLKRLDYSSNDKENILYYPLIITRWFLKKLAGDRRIFCARKYEREDNSIAESIKNLNRQTYLAYKPIVEDICSGRTVEGKELENVLDGLVSPCLSDEMLGLFKQVCREFYNQNQEIITDYVMFYKEMYEGENNLWVTIFI